jgi:hypothetical protein
MRGGSSGWCLSFVVAVGAALNVVAVADAGPPATALHCGGGIGLLGRSDGNVIEDNDIVDQMVGIDLGFDLSAAPHGPAMVGNVLRGNRISNTRGDPSIPEANGDGTAVGPTAQQTVVEKHRVATDNGKLGIAAPLGAVDLGGNRASGNGTLAQCAGVACG